MTNGEPPKTFASGEVPAERWFGAYPGRVSSTEDPEGLGRVKVCLPFFLDQAGPGVTAENSAVEIWACVAVPSAGPGYGLWLPLHEGDLVLLIFERGDPARPFVIGCLWSHLASPPSGVNDSRDNNTTVLATPRGSVIRIDDTPGQERIEIQTPGEVRLSMTDGPGAALDLTTPEGRRISLDDSEGHVRISDASGATVTLSPSGVTVTASQITVDAPTARFSGVVKCDTIIANSVVASSYTSGAGNIW
jgi:uncharacterized protein involved in type VI secretion and phage assembly